MESQDNLTQESSPMADQPLEPEDLVLQSIEKREAERNKSKLRGRALFAKHARQVHAAKVLKKISDDKERIKQLKSFVRQSDLKKQTVPDDPRAGTTVQQMALEAMQNRNNSSGGAHRRTSSTFSFQPAAQTQVLRDDVFAEQPLLDPAHGETNRFIAGAMKIHDLLLDQGAGAGANTSASGIGLGEESGTNDTGFHSAEPWLTSPSTDPELEALVESPSADDQQAPMSEIGYGSATSLDYIHQHQATRINRKKSKSGCSRCCSSSSSLCCCCCLPGTTALCEILNCSSICGGIFQILFRSAITYITFPCMGAAFILFYGFGNPIPNFMVGEDASWSWWLIFFARQAVMFELARIFDYFLVQGIVLRTIWGVQLFGPLWTLWAIQAHGWPLTFIFWSLCDFVLLHGEASFQQSWFSFLGWKIFSSQNDGSYIMKSVFYYRFLIALCFVGAAHSVKRVLVALNFGKRTYLTYKERLEKLLTEVCLVAEVAQLADEVRGFQKMKDTTDMNTGDSGKSDGKARATASNIQRQPSFKVHQLKSARHKLKVSYSVNSEEEMSDDEDTDFLASSDDEGAGGDSDVPIVASPRSDDPPDIDNQREDLLKKSAAESVRSMNMTVSTSGSMGKRRKPTLSYIPDRRDPIELILNNQNKRVQDYFDLQEKQNWKSTEVQQVSIGDILNFQRALTCLQDPNPFSGAFGPASTRLDCIQSSQKCFHCLRRAGSTNENISFHVLSLLAFEDDEMKVKDHNKNRALRRLFRPDQFDQLSELQFVHCIDSVHKRLRFFLASIGNFSALDKTLENVIDAFFHFVVGLGVLLLLDINPYPLLVSMSTLIVSVAFAVGSSASAYIEGVLLIAIRRPYDLGDRIMVSAVQKGYEPTEQWIVDDINLSYTTIRYANTNELATVSNGSIARSRIVNLARSPNALIRIKFNFVLPISHEMLTKFCAKVAKYVREFPHQWESIVYFRILDTYTDHVQYELCVRHRKSWQENTAIKESRASLFEYCLAYGNRHKIIYVGSPHGIRFVDLNKNDPEKTKTLFSKVEQLISAPFGSSGSGNQRDE